MSIGWMVFSAISSASLVAWAALLFFRGLFWLPGPWLEPARSVAPIRSEVAESADHPDVHVIVPARNEADVLEETISGLRMQRYAGRITITVVDDQSTDGTHELLEQLTVVSVTEHAVPSDDRTNRVAPLRIVDGQPLPSGWAGKVWAMHQGWRDVGARRTASGDDTSYVLFTDADIHLGPDLVEHLVRRAITGNRDMVSVMAHLRLDSFWDRLLIPAFVYFFAKLYPFRWVALPSRQTSAAAGGCTLVRAAALDEIGGPEAIASALIDDCALARAIFERRGGGRLWLGMSRTSSVRSTRRYGRLSHLWNMVSRSAFHQLKYSLLLLVGTVLGMLLIYGIPPASAIIALLSMSRGASPPIAGWLPGLIAWAIMTGSYLPILRVYRVRPWMALLLPAGAGMYTAMTITSAFRTWAGRGGAWKGRTYSG